MATTTVVPNGDGSIGMWADEGAGTSNLYSKVNSGVGSPNDSTYLEISSDATGLSIFLALQNMPGDFDTINTVAPQIRARRTASKGDFKSNLEIQIFQSDETTALTDADDFNTTTSFADYSPTLTVTGSTSKSAWDGARIKITSDDGVDGALQVSEVEADLDYDATVPAYDVAAATGTFALTGVAAGLRATRYVSAAAGTFTLTGIAASFSRKLIAATASFGVTGVAASLERGKKLTAAAGAFTLTGIAASPKATRTVSALHAVFQVTAKPVSFIYTLYELDCAAGAFTLTGVAAGLSTTRRIAPETAEFFMNGGDAGLNAALKVSAATATFTLTGQAAGGRTGIGFPAATGAFTLTGISAGARATRKLSPSTAAFTLTARPVAFPPYHRLVLSLGATFTLTGGAVVGLSQIAARTGGFSVTARNAGLTYAPLGAWRRFSPSRSRILQSHTIGSKG